MITTVEKVLFLKSIDLFSQIPGEELSQIALITDEVLFDAGDEIFREGDPGQTLYFILEGKVRIHSAGVADDLATLGERAVFGEMALLDSEPRSASATAIADVVCLKIERDDFNEILTEKGEIAQGIIKVLTRRLRDTLDRRRVGGNSGPMPVSPGPMAPGMAPGPVAKAGAK
jgi:CRP-like cAMP-binding protein